eukprot:TRINITY_DN400_c0_g1_i1.p1 TRINITY_DN400_c0_g1~~TRINITY_DN400_c0_g1_i1.p1  ORF type:complete len:289 (+),score=24.37 TRINITY_DN400_c0_g1_i1:68-934(+)
MKQVSGFLNANEGCSTFCGWLFSISVWLHIVFMSICEPDLDTDYGICDYYRSENSLFKARNWYFYVVLAVSYLLYLSLAWYMPSKSYLRNAINVSADEYQRHLFNAAPSCWFNIECYHYVTSGSSGSSRRKVVTKTKREEFQYSTYSSHCAVGAEYSTAMRLRLSKNLTFSDPQTKAAYDADFEQFVATHTSDAHQNATKGMDIPEYHKYVLAFSDPANRPFGYSIGFYYLCVFFTLSMPYSMYIYWSTKPVDIAVTKEVSLDNSVVGWTPTPPGKLVGPDYEQTEYV